MGSKHPYGVDWVRVRHPPRPPRVLSLQKGYREFFLHKESTEKANKTKRLNEAKKKLIVHSLAPPVYTVNSIQFKCPSLSSSACNQEIARSSLSYKESKKAKMGQREA
mmetsp:Transcript_37784/g.74298  ORF Transcript_37784/g.74298 Transcript_37784/m.74298 type:complete len:108 (+) Transcript_37784:1083-1406(+)